ncbi:MAG TPA: hypothetical protein VFA41_07775 [Ktedonobacteraceae bacterium]|jgi:hypothetical protein|nr:hypothetical protein [Ktedonobacteraceae bacterium]
MTEGTKPASEIAQLRQRIELEHQAAQRGLTGLALGTSKHEFITARMQRSAERLLKLIQEGKHQEVEAIMNHPNWDEKGSEDSV